MSALYYRSIPGSVKRVALRVRFSTGLPQPGLFSPTVLLEDNPDAAPFQAKFTKHGSRIRVGISFAELQASHRRFSVLWKRCPTMLRVFARTDRAVEVAVVDFSDAYEGPDEPVLSFCSARSRALLVPDRQFMRDGYEPFRRLAEANSGNWASRRNLVLWRGAASGIGTVPEDPGGVNDPEVRLRVRMCLLLKDVAGTDVRIARPKSASNPDVARLDRLGVLGSFMAPAEWASVKFAVDIDGFSNAWSNFYTRLLLGCCVIKVASRQGYRQWYYSDLVPWRHYVPVRSDLTDLKKRLEWCRTHDAEAREIAAAGQAFAMARTVATETEATVKRINAALA